MRLVVIGLLLVAAHFSLTAFAPAASGSAWLLWPFASDAKPVVAGVGGLPSQSDSLLTVALAGIAGLGFLAALLSLFGVIVPSDWWPVLVILSCVSSVALYFLYFTPLSFLPVIIDAALLWGVFVQHWTVAVLRGS